MSATIQRNPIFDLIRVLALFLVVLVHTHQGELTEKNWLAVLLFFLGKLGVPLFVMVSGALLLPKQESLIFFYNKRIKKILLPWLVWSVIYVGYKSLVGIVDITSVFELIKNFLIAFLSDFWFMPMIVGVYILTPYLRLLTHSSTSIKPLLIVWLIITSVMPCIYLSPLFPGSASAGLLTLSINFAGYFMLGWYSLKEWKRTDVSKVFLASLIGSYCLYLIGISLFQNNTSHLFFVTQDYLSPALVIGATSLLLLLYIKAPVFLKRLPQQPLFEVSNVSYGIFLSHVMISLLLTSILPQLFTNQSIFGWLLKAFLVYSVSAILLVVLSRIPYLKRYIT